MTVPEDIHWQATAVTPSQRSDQKRQTPFILWFTGLSGAGKTTLANALDRALFERGHHAMLLDGDNVRHGLCRDLGFSEQARAENIRRVAETARLFSDAGLIAITAFISPFRRERALARQRAGDTPFIEVFVDTPLALCEKRDPKGLYRKARAGNLACFTGIDSPYEPPLQPELHLRTPAQSVADTTGQILAYLQQRGLIANG
ncbi:adenylyl-sulfate kinase [Marinobacterium arenosum]|uniref:adenylyl-sulfate kinase n=1 Tax=Marinobacterium arenosum TaxID=2862496 RepID=UPI001C97E31D|nr:adenylyl-sulfate kinase [Marinobacterium arenosum]MBY4677657.1 adenylyl-sulfate kinase [Marinobacterium arenosum]